MSKEPPFITVVTIVYNDAKKIESTIKSVCEQSYLNLNYIVIDGGSMDGTVEIIKKYEKQLYYWQSQKDKGISDAFNQGVKKAKGYILMLNSGDTFVHKDILDECSKHLFSSLVVFEVLNSKGRRVGSNTYSDNLESLAHIPHQGTFVHKSIYEDVGYYSLGFKIRMDYEFFARIGQMYKPKFINRVIVNFDSSGVSSCLKHRLKFETEGILIEYLYFGKSLMALLYKPWGKFLGSFLKRLLK